MLKACVIISAAAMVCYSLWLRRLTWTYRWEKCTTCAIALMALSIPLTNEFMDQFIGRYLFEVTGARDAENVVGHLLLILAAVGIVHTVVSRNMHHPEDLLRRWVHYPACTAAVSLSVLAVAAGIGTPILAGGTWLSTYWLIQSGTLTYLLGFAVLVLRQLRVDPRHRRIATLYMAACLLGILACITRVSPLVLPGLDFPGPEWLQAAVVVLKYLWMGLFAYTAAGSWRQKTRPFQPLQKVLA